MSDGNAGGNSLDTQLLCEADVHHALQPGSGQMPVGGGSCGTDAQVPLHAILSLPWQVAGPGFANIGS